MLNPRLDLYRIFLAAAFTGNFTEAASQLFMTQSAVSQAMAQLEQALETKLFYRSGRGMALTAEGEILKTHLSSAFEQIEVGEQAVSALKNLEAGILHIAASDTLCRHYLLPLFQQFHERYPDIHLQVTNRPSPVCLKMVHQKEADLAFVNRSTHTPPPGIHLEDVLDYEDIFIAGAPFSRYGSGSFTLETLLKEPLILLEAGSSTRENLENWAYSQDLTLTPGIEAGSVDVILDLVRIGLGIGWIPGYAMPSHTDAPLVHVNVNQPPPRRTVAMACTKATAISSAARAFMELVHSKSDR